jgi:hypothetical protein
LFVIERDWEVKNKGGDGFVTSFVLLQTCERRRGEIGVEHGNCVRTEGWKENDKSPLS